MEIQSFLLVLNPALADGQVMQQSPHVVVFTAATTFLLNMVYLSVP